MADDNLIEIGDRRFVPKEGEVRPPVPEGGASLLHVEVTDAGRKITRKKDGEPSAPAAGGAATPAAADELPLPTATLLNFKPADNTGTTRMLVPNGGADVLGPGTIAAQRARRERQAARMRRLSRTAAGEIFFGPPSPLPAQSRRPEASVTQLHTFKSPRFPGMQGAFLSQLFSDDFLAVEFRNEWREPQPSGVFEDFIPRHTIDIEFVMAGEKGRITRNHWTGVDMSTWSRYVAARKDLATYTNERGEPHRSITLVQAGRITKACGKKGGRTAFQFAGAGSISLDVPFHAVFRGLSLAGCAFRKPSSQANLLIVNAWQSEGRPRFSRAQLPAYLRLEGQG